MTLLVSTCSTDLLTNLLTHFHHFKKACVPSHECEILIPMYENNYEILKNPKFKILSPNF